MDFTTVRLPFTAADPFILRASDGRYYLYCTSEDGSGFPVRSSADLLNWTEHGLALRAKDGRWANDTFWAPECYELGGKYVLLYSANWKDNPTQALENYRIGAAVADTPVGPFVDVSDRPIFDPGYPIIDANLYQEGGRYYLYYSRCCYEHNVDGLEESWIYGVELKPDFSGVIGEPVLLLRPEQPWEGRSAAATGRRWNEGSFLMKAGDRYLMTYSGNFFGGPDYAVGYAVGETPLGPFVKAEENPILERHGDVTGTGHSCMLHSPEGELLICYHGRTETTGQDRVGFISPAEVTSEGRLIIHP
ncbi:MAG: glycoside hydrolase family 43 protein [Eubacteriales bacterium]|nr:glycoside hydrolase family 43 protein [Eubacteriales bacterium]